MSISYLNEAITYAAIAALWSFMALTDASSYVGVSCAVFFSFLAGACAVASRYEASE
jgi:hypothetical protein